ncbi:hypothetical protein [Vibrio phage vB_VpaP_G1]|uniref:Uncharacterized protein n=1 Tax=Vibrio phage vB_VpaP_G1 TaxID=2862773 RepID=A0AAE8BMA2_9CAUD|nr:Gp5.5-like host HNS inhibition [Vibrio phage vB_VpaP_G1]YP_010648433.1 Gp5.5-like host HNS inhibition [Vibrio phage vB_VpaP_G1]QYW05801.1 hypothetical protein [Vibrio phage vB_VpaP_G1]QYW05845.1 hypothetical protein [Vibrio phage vB_VpaP_G1]
MSKTFNVAVNFTGKLVFSSEEIAQLREGLGKAIAAGESVGIHDSPKVNKLFAELWSQGKEDEAIELILRDGIRSGIREIMQDAQWKVSPVTAVFSKPALAGQTEKDDV